MRSVMLPVPRLTPVSPHQVMIKTVELPHSKFERCVLPDVYGEVLVLERFKNQAGICQVGKERVCLDTATSRACS